MVVPYFTSQAEGWQQCPPCPPRAGGWSPHSRREPWGRSGSAEGPRPCSRLDPRGFLAKTTFRSFFDFRRFFSTFDLTWSNPADFYPRASVLLPTSTQFEAPFFSSVPGDFNPFRHHSTHSGSRGLCWYPIILLHRTRLSFVRAQFC